MESDSNIIHSNDELIIKSINNNDNIIGLFYKVYKVIVLPYTRNAQDVVEQIGIINEYNIQKETHIKTLITETEKDDDDNSLDTAIRGLKEESGYNIIDETRWIYLDKLYLSKITDINQYCYAVDVTGIQRDLPKPDNKMEELSQFDLVPVSFINQTTDAYILSLIMKLFLHKYGNTFVVS